MYRRPRSQPSKVDAHVDRLSAALTAPPKACRIKGCPGIAVPHIRSVAYDYRVIITSTEGIEIDLLEYQCLAPDFAARSLYGRTADGV